MRHKKPDIKSEMYDWELKCMGTVRSGTKLVVDSGTGPLYLFRWILLLSSVVSSHSGISLSVSYQVGLVACATVNYNHAIVGVCIILTKLLETAWNRIKF